MGIAELYRSCSIGNSFGSHIYEHWHTGGSAFLIPLLTARHSFQLYMNIRKVYLDTIQVLATTIETKDPYTHGHSDRVARYSLNNC